MHFISACIKPEDTFLLYLAGHTKKRKVRLEDGHEMDGYDEVFELDNSELSDDDLTTMLKAIPCRQIICVLDTCFSEGLFDKVKTIEIPPEIHVFCSSKEDELSQDDRFTQKLIEYLYILTDNAPMPNKSLAEEGALLECLKKAVEAISHNWPDQHPVYVNNNTDTLTISKQIEEINAMPTMQMPRINKDKPKIALLDLNKDGMPDAIKASLAFFYESYNNNTIRFTYSATNCMGKYFNGGYITKNPDAIRRAVAKVFLFLNIPLTDQDKNERSWDDITFVPLPHSKIWAGKAEDIVGEFRDNDAIIFRIVDEDLKDMLAALELAPYYKGNMFNFSTLDLKIGRSGGGA